MTTSETLVKMILDRWHASVKNCDTILNALPDENFQKEIAPGKNRGIYLLGHLVAVHDDMIRLLGLGEKMYPHMEEPFLKMPDKAAAEIPTVEVLKACWSTQCATLQQLFNGFQAKDWFQKHTAVSDEDFAAEPHRNKLNIVLTRTTHLAWHTGQLILLK